MGNKIEMEKIYSLSPMQEGMLFHSLMEKESGAYLEQSWFTISGEIDKDLLAESYRWLVSRYDVLRTVFVHEKVKKPMQVVLKNVEVELIFEDLSHLTRDELDKYIVEYRRRQVTAGFDLTKDLPTRLTLFRTGQQSYQLEWSFHHIIMDGWCLGIIFKDLLHIYRLLKEGKPVRLEPVKPYQDYIKWLKEQDKQEGLNYWQQYLEGYERPALLPKFSQSAGTGQYEREEYRLIINEEITGRLTRVAAANKVTVNIVFQTLWGILLQRYNNCNDAVYGSVVSGRPPGIPGVETMVGLFINTVPVRIRLNHPLDFSQFLQEVQQDSVAAKTYEYLSLAEIQGCSPLKRDLIDHIIGFENYPVQEAVKDAAGDRVKNLEFQVTEMGTREQTNYDFNVIVGAGTRWVIKFNFNALVYDMKVVKGIAAHLHQAIVQVAENPHQDVQAVDILPAEEKKQLLHRFNHTQSEYPGEKTIQGLFAQQVQKTPRHPAVSSPVMLGDVYEALNSETLSALQVKKLAFCRFQQSSFIHRSETTIPHNGIDFILLKSHRHNCMVVNRHILALLELFNGKQDIETIFTGLEKPGQEPLTFYLYAVSVTDLLEITYDLSARGEVFSGDNFKDFVYLVKRLYQAHLIELTGFNPDNKETETAALTGLLEIFTPGKKEADANVREHMMLGDLLNQGRKSIPAQVLLLGDTPGTASTGILYLASYLKRNGINARCQFYDPTEDYFSMKQNLEKLLTEIQPAIVAISLKWFPYIARVQDMCRIIKDIAPQVKIVVGGNTASYYWEQIIADENVDYVIRGDGEVPLLKLCSHEALENIPNLMWKKDGSIIENPFTYIQDNINSGEVFLSHLDEIFISEHVSRLGTFFIYTHKGCSMNCCYCGGCRRAQQETFNRQKVLQRAAAEVRKDISAAAKYTSTFQFDFDTPNKNLAGYCREIWEGIDLSNHFCIFANLILPSPGLLELVTRTFKYVYCDIDITTLSERHRKELASLGLVKPQPSDAEILDFLQRCDQFENLEVRVNLITGLPLFTLEDIAASERFLSKILGSCSSFSELHWARLHAQPGASIVQEAALFDMHAYAVTFQDFLEYSEKNFNRTSGYSTLEKLNYPYIYFNDDRLNSRITQFYSQSTQKAARYRENKRASLIVEEELTYQQLHRKSRQLAAVLRERGIGPGTIVGLMLEPSVEMPVGILAILKVGAAYLPLSTDYPETRIKYMLEDSGCRCLVTHSQLISKFSLNTEIITIDEIDQNQTNDDRGETPVQGHPWDIAYTIYTSGTTGKSKGVMVTHSSLVNYIHWFAEVTGLTEADKALLTSSFAFDLGYTSFYPPLLKGGQLHLPSRLVYLSPGILLEYMNRKSISYIKMTPSLFTTLVHHPDFSAAKCRGLRLVVLGGEAIDVGDLEKAHRLCPHITFMNHYGPTEATIGCVAQLIDFDEFETYRKTPVIGKPIANTRAFILNKDSNLLPMGIPGELCISGHCLARGYLNRPELTAEKFQRNLCDPRDYHHGNHRSHSSHKSYIYKTGDLARWLPDGTIEFLGRIDNQVKIKGYRVELGEIETRLLAHPQVDEAVLIVRQDKNDDKYLCAYIVPAQGESTANTGSGSTRPAGFFFKQGEAWQTILKPFERQVQHHPHRIAVKTGDEEITYRDLDRRAHELASEIVTKYDDRCQLSKKEKTRYKRQMLLHGWGTASQEKLKSTTVFVAGVGGGASPTITQLALVGFGTIKICDFDEVELSNLNRQFLHDEERLGMNKALSAKLAISKINPHVRVIPYTQKLTRENVSELVGDSAIIFDMFDGPADKFILSEYAAAKGIPHLILSMTDINAYAAVFHSPHTPCYHCIFDKKKLETIISGMQSHMENYRKNPLPVVSTSLFISSGIVVNEALKILLGFEKPAYNKFFYFNQRGATSELGYTTGYKAMTYLFSDHFLETCRRQGFDWETGWRGNFLEELKIEPDPGCPICGSVKKGEWTAPVGNVSINVTPEPANIHDETKTGTAALLLEQVKDLAIAIPAAFKAGKKVIPIDISSGEKESLQMLEDSEARIIITDDFHYRTAEKLRDKVNKQIALINIRQLDSLNPGNTPRSLTLNSMAAPLAGESFVLNGRLTGIWNTLLEGETCSSNPGQAKEIYSLSQLRDYLLKDLPHYMIPTHFLELEKMPLTPNGKVDHKALPEPGPTGEIDNYIAPASDIEKQLAEILSEVLGVNKIGTTDNFFENGLDSIKAIQITSRLLNFNLKVELGDIFSNPTIKQLSQCVSQTDRAIPQEMVTGNVELLPIQHWFFENHFNHRHHFNLPVMLYRQQGFDEDIVEKVFKKLLEHHDALRMIFTVNPQEETGNKKKVVQFNRGMTDPVLEFQTLDLTEETVDNYPKIIEEKSGALQGSMDIETGPLVKLGLFKTTDGDHLLIAIHHLVIDGISWRILLEDFSIGYQQAEQGKDIRFQDKTDSFKHWSEKLTSYSRSTAALKELEYWKTVEETPVETLPVDMEVPGEKKIFKNNETITLELGKAETAALLNDAHQAYTTEINDLLLTALGLALRQWAGLERTAVYLEGHGREPIMKDIEISRTIGWFTGLYPVILDISGGRDLAYQIKRVKESLRCIPNKGIGYGILRYLTPHEKTGEITWQLHPQISFNYMGQLGSDNENRDPGQTNHIQVSPLPKGNSSSPGRKNTQTLYINGMTTGGKLILNCIFNKYQYHTHNIEKLMEYYKGQLIEIIHHCTQKEEKELTPNDLDYSEVTIDELDELEAEISDID